MNNTRLVDALISIGVTELAESKAEALAKAGVVVLPDGMTAEEAEKAFEKTTAKKVYAEERKEENAEAYDMAVCPNCNNVLGVYNWASATYKCCAECGQKLDFELSYVV